MKTEKRNSTTGRVSAKFAGKALLAAAAFAIVGVGTLQAALVTIGNPGNADNTDGVGGVAYTYQIGKYAVSVEQWDGFYGNGVVGDPNGVGGGTAVGTAFGSTYNYWNDGTRNVGSKAPAVNISLDNAAQYVNWRTTGDATVGAYTINTEGRLTGYPDHNPDTNPAMQSLIDDYGLVYVIASEDEFYKAAYYTGSGYSLYPDGTSDTENPPSKSVDDLTGWNYDNALDPSSTWTVDSGTEEQNGTFNMMGNVWNQVEAWRRGGSYLTVANASDASYRVQVSPSTYKHASVGVRIAAIPEPASGALFVLVGGLVWFFRRRVRAYNL